MTDPGYSPHVTKNQNVAELDNFANFVRGHGVRSYLEIGSKYGASLWRVARAMPVPSRLISVDLPSNNDSGPMLVECVERIKDMGHECTLIPMHSRFAATVAFAKRFGPYDLCYIDADHTLAGVMADWDNYGPMARMVAFHDIHYLNVHGDRVPMEVPILWNQLKQQYRHTEFRSSADKHGIGILFRET